MKVKELIEELNKFNQELEVYMLGYDNNPLDNTGSGIEKIFELCINCDDIGKEMQKSIQMVQYLYFCIFHTAKYTQSNLI